MKKTLAFLLSLTVIAMLTACTPEDESLMEDITDDMIEDSKMMDEKMDESEMMDEDMDDKMSKAGAYKEYSAAEFEEKLGSEPVALFFHASWCPTCIQIEKAINENLANLPEGTTILVADYDDEVKLKQEYGVTSQSTLVFFDGSGTEVERLQGESSFGDIKAALNASL